MAQTTADGIVALAQRESERLRAELSDLRQRNGYLQQRLDQRAADETTSDSTDEN